MYLYIKLIDTKISAAIAVADRNRFILQVSYHVPPNK